MGLNFEVQDSIIGTLKAWSKNLKELLSELFVSWGTYTPLVSPTTGNWTRGSQEIAQYLFIPIFKLIFLRLRLEGTTSAGTTELRIPLPENRKPDRGAYMGALTIDSLSAWVSDVSGTFGAFGYIGDITAGDSYMAFRKYDGSNIAAGATYLIASGFYRTR